MFFPCSDGSAPVFHGRRAYYPAFAGVVIHECLGVYAIASFPAIGPYVIYRGSLESFFLCALSLMGLSMGLSMGLRVYARW